MTVYAASLILIKISDGEEPENFITLGGLQHSEIEIINPALENNTLESGPWRNLLAGAGHRHIRITGEGVYTNSLGESLIFQQALAASHGHYQFHLASGDIISGLFNISHYHRQGSIEREELFYIALESHGSIAFTPAS